MNDGVDNLAETRFAIVHAENVSRETSAARCPISLELAARAACVLEVSVPKPGNVHAESDSAGATHDDFLRSADAVAPVIAGAGLRGVGATVLGAIRATRRVVNHNTNLGIVLLLTPLAAVPRDKTPADGINDVLSNTTVQDARDVYEAIRLAEPGGLGTVPHADISQQPSCTLLEAMNLAAERDLVARQYANGFREVLGDGVPLFCETLAQTSTWQDAVVRLHLDLMSRYPDSLIARKCGIATAQKAARRAAAVLSAGWPDTSHGMRLCDELDAWLRADGNRRNPGTTADLVTACLFVALREGRVALSEV